MAALENESARAHDSSSHSLSTTASGARGREPRGLGEQGPRADDVAQPQRRVGEQEARLRLVPGREVRQHRQQAGAFPHVALRVVDAPAVGPVERGSRVHERRERIVGEAHPLHLHPCAGDAQLGRGPVVFLGREHAELGEAQDLDARRRHRTVAHAVLEVPARAVAFAGQVQRRALEESAERKPGGVVRHQRASRRPRRRASGRDRRAR